MKIMDIDEIEKALIAAVEGYPACYHNIGYAWQAMKRAGHKPKPDAERRFKEARNRLIEVTK
jgi:hypothetical protein